MGVSTPLPILTDPATCTKPDSSPIFASYALLAKVLPAYIGIEFGLLQDGGIAYGEMFESLEVKVKVEVYPRAPPGPLDAALNDRIAS